MKCATIHIALLALSMPLVSTPVKAQDKALPSVNQGKGRQESPKYPAKSDQGQIAKLIQTVMASGRDHKYPNGFAQVVGLDQARPVKAALELMGDGSEGRKCHVVYAPDEAGNARAICLYITRAKKTKHDGTERFFRVSLDGRLEKVVTLKAKFDDQGKSIRSERSKVDEDIDSPEIRKAFKTDMAFWLNDWLKKQQKLDAKKATASAAKPGKTETASAATPQATP